MSYVIRYGQEMKQETKIRQNRQINRILWIAAAACILAVLLVPSVNAAARGLLFPWLNDRTAAAFETMISRIGDGAAVPAALVDFCREIIGDGWIPA